MAGTGSANAKGKGKGNAKEKGKGKEKKKRKGDGQGNAGNQQHSKKGQQGQGAQGHNQQQRPRQQHQQGQHPHPNGQRSGSAPGQSKRQKRKATAMMNGAADDGEHATMDDDRPAAKRHKKERGSEGRRPPSPGPSAALAHPDFWHPDGSVVVEVEKTKFRLHQSTLQKHSAYFAAAFREKEAARQRGGRAFLEVEVDERSPNEHLPVYRVVETTADDFSRLLTVIEEPMKYADETPPMPFLAGVLRAARALSFDAQRKWAERMFERMWPPTLDTLTPDPVPHAAVALALAHNCGLRGVQKRASYELLRIPTFGQSITRAARANAGTGADADADTDADADADVRLGELSRTELLRLLHAREQLSLAWAEVAGKAPTDFPCPRNSETCASANVDHVHVRWAELVHMTGLYAQRMVDPLMGLQDLVEISWKDEGFCKKCVLAKRNVWGELRRKLWDNLDVWLELTR